MNADARRAVRRFGAPIAGSTAPRAVVRDGTDVIVATDCEEIVRANGDEAFAALEQIQRRGGFWVGALSYDLARSIERIPSNTCDDRGFADLVFARFATTQRHSGEALSSWARTRPVTSDTDLGPMTSSLDERAHARSVAMIREHLGAGDCYQINLTRRLTSPQRLEPGDLFARTVTANPAPHAALLEVDDLAIVSASPERFLRVDGRAVTTRPIKGTATNALTLATSAKDHAEHVMIVDLARNDLGRVCEYGSVTVPDLAAPEHHPGIVHSVSTVQGALRNDIDISGLVRATFPAASITGAPKPRVMQLIEELEPVRRGYYCGAIGWIDCDREVMDLAVAIRTFTVSADGTDLGTGGGIVWDSSACHEWSETELKASRLLAAAGAYESALVASSSPAPAGAA